MGNTATTKIFFIVCLILAIATTVSAKTVTLAWDPSPDADVAGYKIYYKAGSSSLPLDGSGAAEGSSPIDVGPVLTTSLSGLSDSQIHYLAVTAYDSSGYESDYSNTVTSSAVSGSTNRAPVLAAIGGKSVNEGANLAFTVSASDPDGDSLTYSAANLPSGASFNASTRTFTWTPNSSQSGSYNVTFSVSDGKLNDWETVAISVANINQAPSLAAIGSKNITENNKLSFTITGSDPDGDSLTYSAVNLPSGASFNASTRIFNWTPNSSQSGNYIVTFRVSDGNLNDTEMVAINVANANQAPVLATIGSKNITENNSLNFTINGSDPDGDSLTYSASNLPSGASFNSATRIFNWTPNSAQAGSYSVTFGVNDGNLNDSETVAITVETDGPQDTDGDGIVDSEDAFPQDPSEWIDTDQDGIGNNADNDDDNDGVSDANDSFPLDPNSSGWLISAIAGEGGSISPAGNNVLDYGASQSFIIIADAGFSISDVLVDGLSVGAVEQYAFTSVDTHHSIEAYFLPVTDGGLSFVPTETGLPGVARADGGDDANNYVDGMPKGDLDYIFSIVLQDSSGGDLPEVILNLNGYAYLMSHESGEVETGATYVYTTRLGPAASQSFHFETRDAYGNLLSRFPADAELAGPQVELLNGTNVVGVPGNIAAEQLDGVNALGSNRAYRWNPSEINYGSYERVDSGGPVIPGESYVIKRALDPVLPSLEHFGENPEMTYEIPVKSGWNLIANPYGGNVSLSTILVRTGSSELLSWTEAAGSLLVVDGIYYYAGADWGNSNIFESSDGEGGAILVPRVGYWIYVNAIDEPVSLVVPKPLQ